jgi:hypothetical protein
MEADERQGRISTGKPSLQIKPEVGSDVNFGFWQSRFDVTSFLLKHAGHAEEVTLSQL